MLLITDHGICTKTYGATFCESFALCDNSSTIYQSGPDIICNQRCRVFGIKTSTIPEKIFHKLSIIDINRAYFLSLKSSPSIE